MTPEQLAAGKRNIAEQKDLSDQFVIFTSFKDQPIEQIIIEKRSGSTRFTEHIPPSCSRSQRDQDYGLTGDRAERYKMLKDIFVFGIEKLYEEELELLETEFSKI